MTPAVPSFFAQDFEVQPKPTQTHKMDLDAVRIRGRADGRDAMRQAIYKALLTERFRYPIYSADYGIETLDLYGQPVSYVCPELERRITEALLCDERITGVDGFVFDLPRRGVVHVSFTVHTVFGDVGAESEVQI